ncbi:acyl-CoA synthetase (AMP-forming)/AMP-acid ligase II [Herbihabitans rhizosphaerae]|uniref:Acyl-CoA synthetase (AMP-forming)/AMP-acid ligase II n=1 Tax=Herbihabitans rhizosphaerae TaxID=1872711 RepID=A0A4Q7KGW7_9PSEU|nr:AMP-binding protein [Herbihabitans rhizosphaerae]RZS34108.1 acyl-CoA synthetase (AMP-forming)/AMP-acid ligase II [Herbihabitans rhizosphaerae]
MSADCVVLTVVVDHPRVTLWKVIGDPELYPRFFRGISFCQCVEVPTLARPGRYHLRASFGDGDILDHALTTMIYRAGEQVVFASEPDTGAWVSIKLLDGGAGRTEVKIVFFRPSLQHDRASNWHDSQILAWARDGLQRIVRYLSRTPELLPRNRKDLMAPPLKVAKTLIKAGIIAPTGPAKVVRQLRALATWGATLAGGYAAAAARSPKDVAIVDELGERTFTDVIERTTRLANGLADRGIGADRPVGVLARNHGTMIETLIACSKLGVDVVLLNTGLSAQQVEDIGIRHKLDAVISDDEFDGIVEYLPERTFRISTAAHSTHTGRPTIEKIISEGADTAIKSPEKPGRLIVLTSGTTGTPKGARRPTPKGLGEAASVLSRIPLKVGDRMLIAAPLFHSWGLAALQLSMPLRSTLVLRNKFDAEDTLAAIAEHKVTTLFAVPIMLQRILNLPAHVRARYDTSSLRIVASSGSALSGSMVTAFMDTFGDVLYNFYGSTEVSWATIADPADLRAAPTTAGRPPLGTRVAILGSNGEPMPPGSVGRIFVGNDMLFDGYTDGGGRKIEHDMMETGDTGFTDADGRLFVSGRDDEMIISGGENVFPRPVEEVLAALPQVEEVAVVGVPDAEYGQRLAAYVVVREGARLDEDAVRAYVHQRLARFSVPRDVTFLEALPRNQTGKVVKRLLTEGDWIDQH